MTVLLVIVIASLVIRWRAVHAAQARLGLLSQLGSAESLVQSLGNENPRRAVQALVPLPRGRKTCARRDPYCCRWCRFTAPAWR